MALKTLLLDLDGTLLDTAPDMVAALDTLLAKHKRDKSNYKAARNVVSQGSAGLLRVGFGITPDSTEFESLKEEFLAIYAKNICINTQPFDGMLDVLQHCEDNQVRWGIVTNKPTYLTTPILEQLDLIERSAIVVCGDTLNVAKPHPAPLLHCTTLLNIAPSDCIYLGDDIRDMQASNAAGMHGAVANWGYFDETDNDPMQWGAEYIIKQPSGLITLINDHL